MKKNIYFSLYIIILSFTSCKKNEESNIVTPIQVLDSKADFTFSANSFVPSSEISFKNLSQNATTYFWDFGDGTTSTETEPKHAYMQMGIYYVKLTTKNSKGENSIIREVKINTKGIFKQSVVIAIDTTLKMGISKKINQFFADLTNEGYQVIIHDLKENQPVDLKKKIQNYYKELTPKLEGIIFIGQTPIPNAWFIYPPSTRYRGLSLQYYMDLDGVFVYNGQEANWIIDTHTGNVEIEIWTSILPYYESISKSITYINDYLDKNHNYRTGVLKVEKGFIKPVLGSKITTEAIYNNQYKVIQNEYYSNLSKRGNFFVGIDNTLGNTDKFPTSRISYEKEILTNKYDVASIGAHGNTVSFGSFNEWGSIIIDVNYARTKTIKPLFLLEHSCNTADISAYPNLATEFLYNKSNNVLAFAGATAPQGGMGFTSKGSADSYEADLLTNGKTIGIAHFAPMTLPYTKENWKSFREAYACQQILLGDGTLKLQEFLSK